MARAAGPASGRSTLSGMQRRRFFVIALFLLALPGCKTGKESLPLQSATALLETSLFAAPNDVQTLAFTSGGARPQKPLPFDGFLYAKHWLSCEATEPGPFARTSVCTFDAEGRTYAHENGWTSGPTPGGCAKCETWNAPLAQAKLLTVSDVNVHDAAHATATYTYEVEPNEIGSQLAGWMRQNPVAWCGVDPRAVGDWSNVQTGTASFVRGQNGWQVDPTSIMPPLKSAIKPARPCPAA
ncbi:MAG: hypothetical protein M3R44_06460 [Candidatus Eremiobacteraeota bacterium]|nr:hypothetical protein [Candidatus Eremiobacteraeota bacterium]